MALLLCFPAESDKLVKPEEKKQGSQANSTVTIGKDRIGRITAYLHGADMKALKRALDGNLVPNEEERSQMHELLGRFEAAKQAGRRNNQLQLKLSEGLSDVSQEAAKAGLIDS